MSLGSRSIPSERRRDPALWAGVLAGPLAWFVQFQVAYWLAPGTCVGTGRLPLHLATLIGLLVALGGGGASWSSWRGTGHDLPSADEEGPLARVRFLAAMGLMSGPLFAVVILAQWFAIVLLDPCPR